MKWVDVTKGLPEAGKMVECKCEYWRYGSLHHAEVRKGKYIQFNGATGHPIFDVDDETEEAYIHVTHWRPPQESGE